MSEPSQRSARDEAIKVDLENSLTDPEIVTRSFASTVEVMANFVAQKISRLRIGGGQRRGLIKDKASARRIAAGELEVLVSNFARHPTTKAAVNAKNDDAKSLYVFMTNSYERAFSSVV